MNTIKEAIDIITQELDNDTDYRRSWVANIAMAFKDEHSRNPNALIHDIANNAAENFISLLCYRKCPDCDGSGAIKIGESPDGVEYAACHSCKQH